MSQSDLLVDTLVAGTDQAVEDTLREVVPPSVRDAWFTSERAIINKLMRQCYLRGLSAGLGASAQLVEATRANPD